MKDKNHQKTPPTSHAVAAHIPLFLAFVHLHTQQIFLPESPFFLPKICASSQACKGQIKSKKNQKILVRNSSLYSLLYSLVFTSYIDKLIQTTSLNKTSISFTCFYFKISLINFKTLILVQNSCWPDY